MFQLITIPNCFIAIVSRCCVLFKKNVVMENFNIDNELLSKLIGVKNECSDYLEELLTDLKK